MRHLKLRLFDSNLGPGGTAGRGQQNIPIAVKKLDQQIRRQLRAVIGDCSGGSCPRGAKRGQAVLLVDQLPIKVRELPEARRLPLAVTVAQNQSAQISDRRRCGGVRLDHDPVARKRKKDWNGKAEGLHIVSDQPGTKVNLTLFPTTNAATVSCNVAISGTLMPPK